MSPSRIKISFKSVEPLALPSKESLERTEKLLDEWKTSSLSSKTISPDVVAQLAAFFDANVKTTTIIAIFEDLKRKIESDAEKAYKQDLQKVLTSANRLKQDLLLISGNSSPKLDDELLLLIERLQNQKHLGRGRKAHHFKNEFARELAVHMKAWGLPVQTTPGSLFLHLLNFAFPGAKSDENNNNVVAARKAKKALTK